MAAGLLTLTLSASSVVRADSLSGLCPDGSVFIVQRAADIPCARAKLVEPDEIPPLRPQLLPNPYEWEVDRQVRSPDNPYNLVDRARRIRDLRAGESAATPPPAPTQTPRVPAGPARFLDLSAGELADLAHLMELSQHIAPAELRIEDARGQERFRIQFAYSPAFEVQVRTDLALVPERTRVLLYAVQPVRADEFDRNFLVVQDAATFRPDPERVSESGILGEAGGALAPGSTRIGYLVLPPRFDPARELQLWWNDQSVSALLAPG